MLQLSCKELLFSIITAVALLFAGITAGLSLIDPLGVAFYWVLTRITEFFN